MTNLYKLHVNVKLFEPTTFEWQFPLSAALLASEIETTSEKNESNEEVEIVTVKSMRAPRTRLNESSVKIDTLPIAPGLTVIAADTAGGKTVTAIKMLNLLAQQKIEAGWITLQETARISTFFSSLNHVADTLRASPELPDVLVIDSFRLTQFGITGGSTRAGGVSSRLFELLTELNSAAELAGIALIVLFNPLAKDQAAAETLNRDVASSVNSLVNLTSFGSGTVTSRLLENRGELAFSITEATSLARTKKTVKDDAITISASEPPASKLNIDDIF